jgi:hypothetical protein
MVTELREGPSTHHKKFTAKKFGRWLKAKWYIKSLQNSKLSYRMNETPNKSYLCRGLCRYNSHCENTVSSPNKQLVCLFSLVRDEYTAHGLHLNSQGKRRLTHLIAERISGGHVSSVSSIPVITHARASPFLA